MVPEIGKSEETGRENLRKKVWNTEVGSSNGCSTNYSKLVNFLNNASDHHHTPTQNHPKPMLKPKQSSPKTKHEVRSTSKSLN